MIVIKLSQNPLRQSFSKVEISQLKSTDFTLPDQSLQKSSCVNVFSFLKTFITLTILYVEAMSDHNKITSSRVLRSSFTRPLLN